MQRRRRAPRAIAHAGHVFSGDPGRCERQHTPVARDAVTLARHPGHLDLQSLDRRVDIARGAGAAHFFAQHVPRLDRLPQLDRDAVVVDGAEAGKAELDERREPFLRERVAETGEIGDDVVHVGRDEMRQQPAVVQRRSPADEPARIRLLPEARDERPQQQHLHRAHPRMRRHFERPELEQAESSRRAVGRIELVDRELGAMRIACQIGQQMPQQAVDEPRRDRLLARLVLAAHLLERDLELVEPIVARFVDARRLARRTDERAGEQVRQRRMVLPVGDEALQQIRPAQERAVRGCRAAQRDMIAAARAGVAPVEHEFLGTETRLSRLFVERLRRGDQFVPRGRRMDIDLDDGGVRRDVQHLDARIARRRVAFDGDRCGNGDRSPFHRGQQHDVILEARKRRHEHMEVAVAHLHAKRRLDHVPGRNACFP